MTTTTTAKITQLEAINEMLQAVGYTPVSTLNSPTGDVTLALNVLDQVSRELQAEGWTFNTERVRFTPDSNSRIAVPTNVLFLKLDSNAETYQKPMNLIWKYFTLTDGTNDGQLYLYDTNWYDNDRTDGYTFNETTLWTLVTYLYEFQELPPACQNYIMLKATRKFHNKVMGDNKLYRYTREDEANAFRVFKQFEGDTGTFNMAHDNYSSFNIVNRNRYGSNKLLY